jgi:hypothetical protein
MESQDRLKVVKNSYVNITEHDLFGYNIQLYFGWHINILM